MRMGEKIRSRGPRASAWVLALLAVLVLVWMVTRLGAASSQLDAQRQQLGAQNAAIAQLAAGLGTTEQQLKEHGISPSAAPPGQILQGATGPAGPGPSDAQVQVAVDGYLLAHPPSAVVPAAQVEADVTAYLALHPPAPGPPPSDAQVAAAVAAYMSAHPAPSGPPGSPGPQGSPGVGQQGPAGPAGAAGQSGAAGSPPAGWTWTDPSGVSYDCAPDGQAPGPHYTCTARPSPSASASVSPSPSASAPPTAAVAPSPTPSPTGSGTATPTLSPTPTATAAPILPLPDAPARSPGYPRSALWPLQLLPLPRRSL
jgi:hypothetical protein